VATTCSFLRSSLPVALNSLAKTQGVTSLTGGRQQGHILAGIRQTLACRPDNESGAALTPGSIPLSSAGATWPENTGDPKFDAMGQTTHRKHEPTSRAYLPANGPQATGAQALIPTNRGLLIRTSMLICWPSSPPTIFPGLFYWRR